MLLLALPHGYIQKRMDRYPMMAGHLGRLITPSQTGRPEATAAAGWTWAADNEAFKDGGFDEKAWLAMLARIAGLPGCRFVVIPDAVQQTADGPMGDAAETRRMFDHYAPLVREAQQPLAYVLQDGLEEVGVPWDEVDAVFVGGSTLFKLGEVALGAVREARARDKWVHMGRVNTLGRIRYAQSIGVDSVDGTKWARWADTWSHELDALRYHQHGLLEPIGEGT